LGETLKEFCFASVNDTYDSYILELSSFQLDGIVDKTTHCYNNKYKSDHLENEYNYQNYINAKFRITMNQTEDDYLIYDADDEAITEWLKNNKTKAKLTFH
jgi:UDP-N-acetylmuramoylalanine--D-glutamate ligase